MLVKNNAKRPIQHTFYNNKQGLQVVEIAGGEIKEIADDVAKLWLKHGLVTEYIEPKKAKEEKEELLEKIAKLEAENAELKKAKEETKTSKKGK